MWRVWNTGTKGPAGRPKQCRPQLVDSSSLLSLSSIFILLDCIRCPEESPISFIQIRRSFDTADGTEMLQDLPSGGFWRWLKSGEHAMLRGCATELGVGSRAQLEVPVAEALGIDRLVKPTSLGLAQPCRICLSALLGSTKSIKEGRRWTTRFVVQGVCGPAPTRILDPRIVDCDRRWRFVSEIRSHSQPGPLPETSVQLQVVHGRGSAAA